ncbi:hypothetical protein [Mucilaginibacter agri]|uniref:Uncharacterized protein n=1 Tax=Mucilaginibacter agri TaxID=2695265 RepID=A0A965ZKB4_9SPHI|nr:hypothetical protein [Mucilaginibacter agri]NCD71608.1 hypothetical protein [Mucilaginibacter agri]
MKPHPLVIFVLFWFFSNCTNTSIKEPHIVTQEVEEKLEHFLDSIGHLPTKPLADAASFEIDSIFKNPPHNNLLLSSVLFEQIKQAAKSGTIDVQTAQQLTDFTIDTNCYNDKTIKKIKATYFRFSEKNFDEYAFCIGNPECNARLAFFKGKTLIAVHDYVNRNGLDLRHYTDADGKMVIFYSAELVRGSGNWWHQLFFYKYMNNELRPILNEIEDGNMANGGLGDRVLSLDATIQTTSPLTIKMVFSDQLPDTTKVDFGPLLIKDSTTIQYIWDQNTQTLKGQYRSSKLSQAQKFCYYSCCQDLLFINTHYKLLKNTLIDKERRETTLKYLNLIKSRTAH